MAANRKYRWEEWFEAGDVTLLNGLDYQCSQSSMVQIIRNNATRFGYYVRLTDIGVGIRIEVLRRRNEVPHTDQAAVAE